MKLDNETLTAYALGELDEPQRQAVEDMLRGNEAAREAVVEIQATAQVARLALHAEEPVALESAQVAAIEEKAGRHRVRRRPLLVRVCLNPVAIMAAMLVIVTATVLPGVMEKGRKQRLTKLEQTGQAASYSKEEMAQRWAASAAEKPQKTTVFGNYVPSGTKDAEGAPVIVHPGQLVTKGYDEAAAPGKPDSKKELDKSGLQNVVVGGQIRISPDSYGYRVGRDGDKANIKDAGSSLALSASPTQESKQLLAFSNIGDVGGGGQEGLARGEGGVGGGGNFRQIPPGTHPPEYQDPNKVYWPDHNTEAYASIQDNPFKEVAQEPLSTFSIDVDTASYSNMRRFLTQGQLPPPDSVRIEELLNYFDYDYAPPQDKSTPFAAHVEVAGCPWAPEHRLARIGLKGWEIPAGERPASNLVFLIDVSGSMQPENKLPLLKEAMKMLVRQLDERDRIAIVVYAGNSGLVLPSTPGNELEVILGAIDGLESGGSTHGSAGIQLAYETAVQNFLPGGTNRVILCTDGDFNVGTTDEGQLTRIIEEKAKSKVFLTVLGFGMGNLKDSMLETLADKGNGNYAYIDTLNEARKVLVQGLGATLVTIAKDVKIQVEFNPAQVKAYRLIGYENRILAAQDFNDDTKDAGEIGAGHTVTALYELVPPGGQTPGAPTVDPLKYQQQVQPGPAAQSGELLTLKLRYKEPEGDTSKLLQFPVRDEGKAVAQATPDFGFAASVAELGMILRGSQYKGSATYDSVLGLAEGAIGKDPYGYRSEFLQLVQKAKALPQGGE